MTKVASRISLQAFSVVFAAGMLFVPATGQAGQGVGSSSSPGSSGFSGSVPEVQSHPESGFGTQWSDQLKREQDQAKQSRDQAEQERDQAQQERDQALQAGKGSQDSASGMKSIQGQSSSASMGGGSGNQETDRMLQERDKFLQERDALQKETSDLRQERDRAMRSIAGGSALDAVDRTMPVTPRH